MDVQKLADATKICLDLTQRQGDEILGLKCCLEIMGAVLIGRGAVSRADILAAVDARQPWLAAMPPHARETVETFKRMVAA